MVVISSLFVYCSTPSSKGFQTDFALFTQILKQAHAGIYKYHSPNQVDSVFAHYQHQINESTDLVAFYSHLTAATTYLGSLHDSVSLPDSTTERLAQQAAFFPYPVRLLDSTLVCDARNSPIPAGATIDQINGIPVSQLLPRLEQFYTTDGNHQVGKQIGINQHFSWFFRLAYGPFHSFKVMYHPCGQRARQLITVAAQSLDASQRQARYNPFPSPKDLPDYTFQLLHPHSTARLTVNTFEFKGQQVTAHRRYRHFLDSCFRVIKRQQIRHLIVDIRQNGGGDDPNDLVTFSYVAHQPFRENKTAFTLFRKVPFPQYYLEEEKGERTELESELRGEFAHHQLGRYYQVARYNALWRPNPLAFRGQLYLLISPAVASAGSLFASLVASEGQAVLIGQETMGGYYGHTGHKSVTYKLPSSKIRFRFSIVDLQQAVTPQGRIAYGRGVVPTYVVGRSCASYLRQNDVELETALSLIKANQ
ncbi:hypothetical protein GCM10028817_30650 [Spirosoma pomorum]